MTDPVTSFEPFVGELADELAAVDAACERMRLQTILPNVQEALRVELTYHSNAIEGSTLTLRDTQLVIEGREPNSGKTLREIYEARNHDRALRAIEAWPRRPLALSAILEVHALVMADVDAAGAGRLRTDRVLIFGTRFVPPGPHKFPALLAEMLEFANQRPRHAVLQAAELHYNLVAVHPFADGNGRTARLAMNAHLLRHGYPLAIVPVERRAEYLRALDDANDGRGEPFAAFLIDCLLATVRQLTG